MIESMQISFVNLWNTISRIQNDSQDDIEVDTSFLKEKINAIGDLFFRSLNSTSLIKNDVKLSFRINYLYLKFCSDDIIEFSLVKKMIFTISIGLEILGQQNAINLIENNIEYEGFIAVFNSWFKKLGLSISSVVDTYLKVLKHYKVSATEQNDLLKTLLDRQDADSLNLDERISLFEEYANLTPQMHLSLVKFLFSKLFSENNGCDSEEKSVDPLYQDVYFFILDQCLKFSHFNEIKKLFDVGCFERINLYNFNKVVPSLIENLRHIDSQGGFGITQRILNYPDFKKISSKSIYSCFEALIRSLCYRQGQQEYKISEISGALLECPQFKNISCQDKQKLYLMLCTYVYRKDVDFIAHLFDFQSLANFDWSVGIPDIYLEQELWPKSNQNRPTPIMQLGSLEKIVWELKNPLCLKSISPGLLKKLIRKCRPSPALFSGKSFRAACHLHLSLFTYYRDNPKIISINDIMAEEMSKKTFCINFKENECIKLPIYFKEILAANSDYFRHLFASKFKEAREEIITLGDAPAKIFQDIIHYCNNGFISLNKMTFNELVELATQVQYFCINELIEEIDEQFCKLISSLDTKSLENFFDVIRYIETDFTMSDQLQIVLDLYLKKFLDDSISIDAFLSKFFNGLNIPQLTIRNKFLSDKGLENLKDSFIKKIKLNLCKQITSEGLSALSMTKDLESLEVDSCELVDDDFLMNFKDKELKSLKMFFCKKFQGTGWQYLADTSINTIDCSFCNIVDGSLIFIKKMRYLKTLVLSYNEKISDLGLSPLSEHPSLTSLSLNFCPNISAEGIFRLEHILLEHLSLSGCKKIDDNALIYLSGMPLKILDLSNTNISDAGLVYLYKLPLAQLDLRGCKVSMEAVKSLEEALTNHQKKTGVIIKE